MNIQPHRLRYYFAELERPRLCLWTQVLPWALTLGTVVGAVAAIWYITQH